MKKLAASLALCLGAYAFFFRPLMLRWGATYEEVHDPFPGAGIIPGGVRGATMAVTIDAPPSNVWQWLLQMGYRRAGWYSWDYLDNFGRRSADSIHPEWQNVRVGEFLAGPDASPLEAKAWEVAALEPERFLGLRARPNTSSDSLWGFWLKDLPDGKTRLIVSGYWATRPLWLRPVLSFALLEWTHWIMQMKQFANLKRLAQTSESRRRRAHAPIENESERSPSSTIP